MIDWTYFEEFVGVLCGYPSFMGCFLVFGSLFLYGYRVSFGIFVCLNMVCIGVLRVVLGLFGG